MSQTITDCTICATEQEATTIQASDALDTSVMQDVIEVSISDETSNDLKRKRTDDEHDGQTNGTSQPIPAVEESQSLDEESNTKKVKFSDPIDNANKECTQPEEPLHENIDIPTTPNDIVPIEDEQTVSDSQPIETVLFYEDKERAVTFYTKVFEMEVESGQEPSKDTEPVSKECESGADSECSAAFSIPCEEENNDVRVKGFKLRATLSPKKKKTNEIVQSSKIFVPANKLQDTLDRIKEYGELVTILDDVNDNATCIVCPEGNRLTLVPSKV